MFFLWFVKLTSAPFLFVYFKLKLYGDKRLNKPDSRTIIIANHTSTWDPVLVNYIYPTKRIYFMTAAELFRYSRLFTWFLYKIGAFPVERTGSDLSALGKAGELLMEEKIVGVFPEGRRSLDGKLLPFKPGVVMLALNSRAPIIPVYISGKYGLFHRKKAVVGEKFALHEYCDEAHPGPEKIRELSQLLQEKLQELADRIDT